MTLRIGLSIIIILCAIPIIATALRQKPASKPLLLLGLGFVLMGGSDFLEPVSEPAATAVNIAGLLIIFGVGIRTGFSSKPAEPKG